MQQHRPRLLAIDDDPIWLEQIPMILEDDCTVVCADNIDEGLKLIENNFFDIVILDLNFNGDGRNGLDVFGVISAMDQGVDVLVISGETDVNKVVRTLNAGVKRFLSKPADNSVIRANVREILAEREVKRRALSHIGTYGTDNPLIGSSPLMQRVREDIGRIVESGAKDILILGESGTGKELVARSIAKSCDRLANLLPVHCGAITDSIAESELFGHVRGAFTGANTARPGVFEAAKGGFVFLDEIAEMPLGQQAKLLRVLQERKVRPVGANAEFKINFRTIAATNRNLSEEIAKGNFREDLYYRIAKEVVVLPSLRERREDIPELVNYFLKSSTKGKSIEMSVDAMVLLQNYRWPGNVRELKAIVESLIARASSNVIREDLILQVMPMLARNVTSKPIKAMKLYGSTISKEIRRFEDAIAKAHGNRTKAAEFLGISRATFFRRAKELGLVNERSQRSNSLGEVSLQ